MTAAPEQTIAEARETIAQALDALRDERIARSSLAPLGDVFEASAALAALVARAAAAEQERDHARWVATEWMQRAERAEAETQRLREALRLARNAVADCYHAGWDSTRRDITLIALGEIDAALSGGGTRDSG